jgi:DNA invertase Pin-like site-specific DNA recombinase
MGLLKTKIRGGLFAVKKVAIYARVSTKDQSVEMQLADLRKHVAETGGEIVEEYIDEGFSGKNTKRPAYTRMMEDLHRRRWNVLLVWKLDRLARSVIDLVNILETLRSRGADFVSFRDQHLDTTTPAGMLLYHIMASVAQFERSLTVERVKTGMAHARSKGKAIGRPAMDETVLERIPGLLAQGLSRRAVARELKISDTTVRKHIKANDCNRPCPM